MQQGSYQAPFSSILFHFSSLLCNRTPLKSLFKGALEGDMGQAGCNGETNWGNQLSSTCFPCLQVGWFHILPSGAFDAE